MATSLTRIIACTVVAAGVALSFGYASAKRSPSPGERFGASRAACTAPSDVVRLDHSLEHVTQKILARQPLTIVAIGSSSTYGEGASSPRMNYPSRLAVELKALFPESPVTVLNRGVNGETSADMLERFDSDVFAAAPDLVIWQVGSNSVLSGLPLGPAAALIHQGLDRLKAAGADAILIDPQYAPEIVRHGGEAMVDTIAVTAREARVNLFHRYAVMRHWRLERHLPFRTFVAGDELHMNDWSYGCVAHLLAGAIHDTVTRPSVTASAR